MPQALKNRCHTQVGRNPFSHFQPPPLWGNKNWPPSIKVEKFENLINKIGLKCCKWSSLNAPGTKKPVPCSGWENSTFPFSPFLSLYKSEKVGKSNEQNWLKVLQMVQFERPKIIHSLKNRNRTSPSFRPTTLSSHPHPRAADFPFSMRENSTTAAPLSRSLFQHPTGTTTRSSPKDCHSWRLSEDRPKIPFQSLISMLGFSCFSKYYDKMPFRVTILNLFLIS